MAQQAMGVYIDDIRFVYHHYPNFDSEYSVILSESLEAAGAQEKFWELHSKYLEKVPDDTEELLIVAEEIGLDMQVFVNDIEYGKFLPTVVKAAEDARQHNVEHTALFINEKEFTEKPDFDNLITEIEKELERISNNGGN